MMKASFVPTVASSTALCAPAPDAGMSAASSRQVRLARRTSMKVPPRCGIGPAYEWCRLPVFGEEGLRSQLGAELPVQRRDDPLAEPRRVLVRQRPLRRLERHGKGERLLACGNRRLAVVAEEADLAQVRAGRLAGGCENVSRRDVHVDDEREVLVDGRVG